MTWSKNDPEWFESDKIRFEALPYLASGGLDVGCGQRKVWPHLVGLDSQKDNQLFGLNISPDIVIQDAAKLGMFADGAIENVFSSHLLEHLTDHVAALREWWRVLKPGGHLILYLPHRDLYPQIGQPGSNSDHKHDFAPDDIVDVLQLIAPDWTLLENQTRDEKREYSFLQVWRKEAAGVGQHISSGRDPAVKTAAVVRVGGNGDALWAASVAAHLHEAGHAVTAFVTQNGADVLRHDPNIARIIVVPSGLLNDEELLEYWAWQAPKFDKWVNLIGSVEGRLLPHQSVHEFYLPQHLRHELMNRNYLDMVHAYAEMPAGTPSLQRFYPSAAETTWAQKMREGLPGPVVLLSPTGSGKFKAWPHAQRFMELMADAGIYTVMVGDLTHLPELDLVTKNGTDFGHIVGMEWPLRLALAYTLQADIVVATESVFANAAAFEPMPKVVMLSHSSNENLTRDWRNCIALEAPVPCHPCHRIHNAAATLCAKDTTTGAAACMAHYSAELVADLVLQALRHEIREAA